MFTQTLSAKLKVNNPIIKISELRKQYKGSAEPALADLSLEIPEGEIFGLLGPNGAGKTTTISIIAGLLKSDTGNIEINGLPVERNINDIKKLIGLVPQDIALYQSLSARENLRFFGAMQGLESRELKAKIDSCLDMLGLTKYADKKIATFSGGMKRRVNLIAGALHQPKVLILDEPTAGIDVQSRITILDYLRDLNESGTTIIYTSHNLSEAENFCTRAAIIDYGKLVITGTPKELIEQHQGCRSLEEVFIKLTGRGLRDE
ncbi:MAG: type transport system ATP-binding protein [Bacteroidota bacterium]|nr:type transport system ATP-binding protein [Bacteroidota bacterium]